MLSTARSPAWARKRPKIDLASRVEAWLAARVSRNETAPASWPLYVVVEKILSDGGAPAR